MRSERGNGFDGFDVLEVEMGFDGIERIEGANVPNDGSLCIERSKAAWHIFSKLTTPILPRPTKPIPRRFPPAVVLQSVV
jgi:hypothetical protein